MNIKNKSFFIVFLFMNAFTIEEGTLLYMISAFTFAAVNWLRYVVFDRKKQLKAEEQKATSVESEENEGGIAEEGVR